MLKKIVFILINVVLVSWLQNANAQILIEEGKVKLGVESGKMTRGQMVVHNTSKEPMKLRVYLEDFQYVSPFDGKKKFFPAGSLPNSLNQFISFTPKELNLPPYGKSNVEYSLQLPPEAKGGYYGVLFAETGAVNQAGEIAVNIVARVGALMFVETKNRIKSAKIENIDFAGAVIKGGFVNAGNVILIPHGVYYVLDKDGMVVDRGELPAFYLPPNEKNNFEFKLNPKLAAGNYNCVLTFDLEDSDSTTREIKFIKDSATGFHVESISE